MRSAGGPFRIGLCLVLLAMAACGIKGDPETLAAASTVPPDFES